MFPVKASADATSHSYLAFSFETAGRTDILQLVGDTFSQVSLPGLDMSSSSLLVANLAGDWVAQVSPKGVTIASPTAAAAQHNTWTPPAPGGASATITLGVSCGSHVAVVTSGSTGAGLHILSVSQDSGKPVCISSAPITQQVSAMQLFGVGDIMYLAVGYWIDNRITIQEVGQGELVLDLDLGNETPRSIALLLDASRIALVVGTNSGAVMVWDLSVVQPGASCAPSSVTAELGYCVHISDVAVRLVDLVQPGGLAYVVRDIVLSCCGCFCGTFSPSCCGSK